MLLAPEELLNDIRSERAPKKHNKQLSAETGGRSVGWFVYYQAHNNSAKQSKAEQSRAKATNGQLQKPKPQKIYSGPASVPGTYRLATRTPQRDPHGNGCQGAVAGVEGVSPAKNGIEPRKTDESMPQNIAK